MEAHGSFYGIFSWKLQLMNAMEASTSTNFKVSKILLPTSMEISMEVNLLPLTHMEVSMEANLLPWKWKLPWE